MLAVRRAGVTAAVSELKRLPAIEAADNSYRPPEAEYEKLFADAIQRS